jgi:lipoprotein-anchoring transpeptidase ErfK/SrfK
VQPPESRLNRQVLRREQRRQELRRDYRQGDVLLGPADDGYYSDDALAVPANPNGDDYYNNDPNAFPEAPGGPRVVSREPLQNPDDQPALPSTPTMTDRPLEPSIAVKGREDVAALQVLLDRGGASPGVIDGRFGSNVDKALAAYNEITGSNLKSTDSVGIQAALAQTGGDAFANYTITAEDAAGPYVASIPEDYSQKAQLDRMAYTSVTEALAERFHMDENYLKALNPDANFNRPGTVIKVANFGKLVSTPVARIVADKGKKEAFAYDAAGKLVAAYPATIGSADTPSPTGTHAVSRVALDPNYTYNPKHQFQAGRKRQGPDHSARAQRSCRVGLDRPGQADLRHPRHAGSIEDRQDRKPWLCAPDQLGCARTGQARQVGRTGRVHGIGQAPIWPASSARSSCSY